MLCPFGLIFFDGFNVYLLLIFVMVALFLMMSSFNVCLINISQCSPPVLLGGYY
ncbi:hypothetical protein SEHO0A_01258 [Salmonella enterica subsp. houtenae str. ATCC BAA-1581]|nr:hypothetical protein SEHO0A_01258 [Salmonella enterica subsp. houtenae str. ATCC BAA-1581]